MLIESPRHTARDLAAWDITRRTAIVSSRSRAHRQRVARAERELMAFVDAATTCYAGVSWGKDSVVVADMIARLRSRVPLVWVRLGDTDNPDCPLVRDAFLVRYPSVRYEEIVVDCEVDEAGGHASGLLRPGFDEASIRFGRRHISGIRGEESRDRRLRMMAYGASSEHSCAPLGWFSGMDVFAYLVERELPIHPAYACTMGGALDPVRVRVASLGGERGRGMGRAEWERLYYGPARRAERDEPHR